jgi:ParB/RepB/Spo0J family partition protein
VHDFDASQTDTLDVPMDRTPDDEVAEDDPSRELSRPVQREGLPAHYRMRAERHYVDSIASGAGGVPIRLIAVSQFEVPSTDAAAGLEPLVKSIRVHGIVQPLLVRKRQSRYEVIAGRRRFAAAVSLGLTEVPCVLHQVDDETARALAQSENIRAAAAASSLRATMGAHISEALGRIADDLGRLQSAVDMLRRAPDNLQRSVAADLMSAQAARTSWLAHTAALLAGGKIRQGLRRPLSTIADDVIRQFESESRLAGLRIELTSDAPALIVDDRFVSSALTAAIMMTLTLLEHTPQPRVDVQLRALDEGGFAAHVVQRLVPASPDIVERFTSRTRSAWTPMVFALGAMALEHATAAHGGAADLVPLEEVGSAIQLTFCRL